MNETDWLAEQFEGHRAHLSAVAYRMLGSQSDADDAMQASWLRVSRAGAVGVENLGGWLTTVVARVCLNMLRQRTSRREEPLDAVAEPAVTHEDEADPEHEALLADSVGVALLAVLDVLSPPERVALVLHDMFGVSFAEIGVILDRSPEASRQLASRARRRVRGAAMPPRANRGNQRGIVDAFLAASRSGDFGALVALLDPDVVLRADIAAVKMGASAEVTGAEAVAHVFFGRAQAAQPALIDGSVGVVWAPGGRPKVVWQIEVTDDSIVRIDMVAADCRLDALELVLYDD
jgi:RNA polymerase sigma-70 factor (ECF subfamily)